MRMINGGSESVVYFAIAAALEVVNFDGLTILVVLCSSRQRRPTIVLFVLS